MKIHKKEKQERKAEKERRHWTSGTRSVYSSFFIYISTSVYGSISVYGGIPPYKDSQNRHKWKAEAQKNQLIEVPKHRIKAVEEDSFPQAFQAPLRLSEGKVEKCHSAVPKEIRKDIGKYSRL